MSDYWKKKLDQLNKSNSQSYWDKKSAELRNNQKQKVTVTTKSSKDDDDLAPIRKDIAKEEEKIVEEKKEEERTWFQKGAFDDGFSLKNLGKAIIGSAEDVIGNVGTGIAGMGEKVVDSLAFISPYLAQGQLNSLGGSWLSPELQKTQNQVFEQSKADMAKFIEKDLYDEEKLVNQIYTNNTLSKQLLKANPDDLSVFGEKSDSLAQSAGQLAATAALSAAGVPWYLTTGVTSFGGEAENALKSGATMEEAGLSAAISAGAEILTEKISGGIKFGGKALDDALVKELARGVSNKTVRTLLKLGIDATGEGFEEVLSGVIGAVGQKLTYADDKELSELFSKEEAWESFIGGAVLGGGSSVINVVKSVKKGIDPVSELTQNEQKVVDKEYKERVAEAEKQGKVSQSEKSKIYDQVLEEMEKGYISTDSIEAALGGETFKAYQDTVKSEDDLQKEFDALNKMKQGEMTGEQIDRRTELKEKLADIKQNSKRNELKTKLSEEVMSLVSGDRLAESYNERSRRQQAFQADLTQYNEKQKAVVQKAVESGILNNTNRTHEFVDMVAKISADKGVLFDFTNNAKLKESGFALNGATVNGYKTADGIVVNVDSAKSRNFVVGHEITHVLEGTELYGELQQAVFDFAKTKGEYDSRLASVTELYKKYDPEADPLKELTSDLVGEYVFSDPEFVNNLSTEHRNVFQKVYDEIKYLLKVATAGSKEARELEKVKRIFEQAYRAETKNTAESGVKHSLSDTNRSRITQTMTDEERTQILSKKSFEAPVYEGQADEAIKVNQNDFESQKQGLVKSALVRIGEEFGVFTDYNISDVGVKIELSKGNLKESVSKEVSPVQLAKLLPVLKGTVENAIGVESHANRYFYDNYTVSFDNLVGGYFEGDSFVPIRFGLKHNKSGEATLYVIVDQNKIDAKKIKAEVVKTTGAQDVRSKVSRSAFNVNLAQIVPFVNSKDLLRYIPDGMLNESQKQIKWEAIAETVRRTNDKNDKRYRDYLASGNVKAAQNMVDEAAKVAGYTLETYHGTDAKFTVFEKGDTGFHSGTKNQAEGRREYVGTAEKDWNIMKLYHNIKNPLTIEYDAGDWSPTNLATHIIESRLINDLTDEEIRWLQMLRHREDAYSYDRYNSSAARDLRDFLREKGYDGVKYINEYEGDDQDWSYIAFDSNQYKSADPVTYDDNGNVVPISERFKQNNPDIRFSLSDSTGRQISQEQADYFKDSKVRDENGNLKVMYHGTPNGEFTVFKDGTYFTDNKEYADRYQNPGASSISTGKTASNPKTFEVYLDIKKPFDLSDPEAKRIYIEDYIKGGNAMGINPYLSDAEYAKINTIDWTEGEDLRDFLTENDYDYDGLVLDEGADGGYGDEVKSRGTSYVVFSPEQVKNIDNANPTANPDIHKSISDNITQQRPVSDPLTDLRLEGLPVQEDVAPVKENAADVAEKPAITAEEMFPDDTAPVQEEYERLLAERDDIVGAMDAFAAVGDYASAEQLMPEYEAVQNRIAEIEADDADRFASIDDADAPPEMDNTDPEDVADNVPLTKTLVTDLAKQVKAQLGLGDNRTAEVRELIERYSNEEFPSKAHLYTEIQERFGTITETEVDEELKNVKARLRTYGINVDESIKAEIPDYAQMMRSNFGKVRFSKEGLPVDVAYAEFQEAMPGYFPESIYVPTDQLMRIIEVANMDTTMETEYEIDWQTLEDVTDTIMNGVSEFKQNRKETLANRHGRESFQSLMEDADQFAPPIPQNTAPVRPAIESVQSDDIAPVFDTSSGQQALMPEVETPKRITRKELHQNIMDDIKTEFSEQGFDFDKVLKDAKDLSTFATVDNTPQRVMEKALGYKEGQTLSDLTVNKVAQNETDGIRWLNSFTDKKTGLLAKISKQYGIKPGSKASAAAQMYAEGFYVGENDAIIAYGDKELAVDFPDKKVQDNIKKLARDPRIRQIYDETLAAINESRTRNAYPEIPRLDNYFLHFRAMEDTFSRLGLPFNPNDIRAKDLPTDLNGVTADLKPGQPYFASAKHRTGKRTSFDLLGGLENYLTSAKNQIYHIDDIQTLRALRNYVAETYGQATGLQDLDLLSDEEAEQRIHDVYNSHLSTFAKFLNEEANVLAGKTSLIDRGLEGIIGRRGITFLDTLNRQVGANMVGFNVSSSLTNFLAPVQAFAKTNKFDFVKAMAQTAYNKVANVVGKGDNFTEESPVMIRRKGAERFYRTPYQKVADKGYILMGVVDDISTELIARTKYNEFTRKGMDSQKAHYETDKWVSRLMGDRSLGQQPQLYNSKMLGLFTKFQLEVRNQLDSQFYDTIQEAKVSTEEIQNGLLRNAKKAAKITSTFAQLAVMQHLFGKAFESVAGYNPAFDIIEALIKTFGWDDDEESEDTVLDNIEEGFMSLLEDLPYTSTLTGGRIPIASALPITEFIKGEDQYGNEKSRWQTLGEAAPYYILPGGYGQIKKTKAGLQMFDDDLPIAGSYTDSGNLRFTVEDTTGNRVQAALFGQWASENARDYFDNERKALQEKQIQELIDTELPIDEYRAYRDGLAKYDKLEDKVDYIDSLDLPISTKNILVNNVANRKEPIDMTNYDEYGSLEEMDFATKNPEKYEVALAVGGYKKYMDYQEDMKEMKLAEKVEYVASLNLTTKQKNILINGETDRKEPIDLTGYENFSSFEEFEFAKKNPESYAMAKTIGGYEAYTKYSDALGDIKADKDKFGNSISGSRKKKVAEYISSLNIPAVEKYILFKSEYPSTDDYNYEIVEYVNGRRDLTFEEKIEAFRKIGFDVDAQGNIYW